MTQVKSNYNLSEYNWKYNISIRNFILNLNDNDFWNLINVRLCLPSTRLEIERGLNGTDIEYWTIEHLIDELFLLIAKKREIISYNGEKITIYKYYNQALRMWK